MEGEVTVICLDTSSANPCLFLDQQRAVEFYCARKLHAHPDNLVGMVTSGHLHCGCLVAPTNDMVSLTDSLESFYKKDAGEQVSQCIDTGLLRALTLFHIGVFPQQDRKKKKRIVLFCRGGSPSYTTGHSPQAMASFLKARGVALDVIDFGTRVMDKEDFKAKYLKALVYAMNDNNENEDSRYFLFDDESLPLSRHISASSILPPISSLMEGEVTMIFVDTTSTTSLSFFMDQIGAVKLYCGRKLTEHPRNLVSVSTVVQGDLVTRFDPTNSMGTVVRRLCALKPRKQEYTDVLEWFKLIRHDWFGYEHMKKRIVVFSGSPFSTTRYSTKAIASFLKKGHMVLDVFDFSSWVMGKEECEAGYLKALVAAMNDNNVDEYSRYFPIEDDRFSLYDHILRSSILPTPSYPYEVLPKRFNNWSELYYEYCCIRSFC